MGIETGRYQSHLSHYSIFPTRELGSHGGEGVFRLYVVCHASQVFQLASYIT
jgi:hypothetical protein